MSETLVYPSTNYTKHHGHGLCAISTTWWCNLGSMFLHESIDIPKQANKRPNVFIGFRLARSVPTDYAPTPHTYCGNCNPISGCRGINSNQLPFMLNHKQIPYRYVFDITISGIKPRYCFITNQSPNAALSLSRPQPPISS